MFMTRKPNIPVTYNNFGNGMGIVDMFNRIQTSIKKKYDIYYVYETKAVSWVLSSKNNINNL